MITRNPSRMARLLGLALLSGCASTVVKPPDTPPALRPPADQVLSSDALAIGVQIYECGPARDDPARHAWVFKAPEAELRDRSGHKIGKHYAGPTWESIDGSAVVGAVKASDPGPDPEAIPWLLLTATSHTGTGVFGRVASIQRLQTIGGKAPAYACSAQNAGSIARVPYSAVYYFYSAAP